jgi:hypothetical protein
VLQDWSSAVTSGAALNDEDARLRRPRVGRLQRDSIENRHQRIDLGIIEKHLDDLIHADVGFGSNASVS